MKSIEFNKEDIEMELLNTHPIKKSDLGFHGNLFGGNYWLGWMPQPPPVRCKFVTHHVW